jgi:hypothetical protein
MHVCMHICSHMGLFLPYMFYTVWCLSKSYELTNNLKKTCLKKNKKQTKKNTHYHRWGLMLGLADLIPECWLEVRLHPVSPATGQLDQSFPWFSLIPEQMLSWHPNSTLQYMRPMQPSQW